MKDKPLSPELDTIELYPDAQERMERAVKMVAAHKPIHRAGDTPTPSVVGKRKT